MEPLLDSCLQLNTTSHLFHLEPPKYTSAAGRRIDKNDAPTPPAPMVYTPDSRLGRYCNNTDMTCDVNAASWCQASSRLYASLVPRLRQQLGLAKVCDHP